MAKIYSRVEFEWNEEEQIYEEIYSESYNYEGEIALCGGGGDGGGGGGDTQTTIRYAPYVEESHRTFLEQIAYYAHGIDNPNGKLVEQSPFEGYVDIDVETAFFGAGYLISSFPSLYDMYGKFMAGLDIEVLWHQALYDTVSSALMNELIAAEGALLDDDIEINSLPRLQIGMRDINSVMASSYVIGKSIIEDARVKSLAKFSAQLKYNLIPYAVSRWQTHLEWNKGVVGVYAELMKFYYSAKTDVDEINYAMAAKHKLWPFTVLDFERAALGALQAATNTKTDVAGASTTAKVISGALSGAAMGTMVGGSIKTGATAAEIAAGSASTYAGVGSIVGAGLGVAAALTY